MGYMITAIQNRKNDMQLGVKRIGMIVEVRYGFREGLGAIFVKNTH